MSIALKKTADTCQIIFFLNKLTNKIRNNRMNASTKKGYAVTYEKKKTFFSI